MRREAHGVIVTASVVIDITDAITPPRQLRPRVLWHVAARPAPAGYLEARPWFADPITREYHESRVAVVACSVAGARRLMPTGLEEVDTDGLDGAWFAAPAGARRAA